MSTAQTKVKNQILGVTLVAIAAFSALSLYMAQGHAIGPNGAVGLVGGFVARVFYTCGGQARYLLPIIIAFIGFKTIVQTKSRNNRYFNGGLALMFLSVVTACHLSHAIAYPPGAVLRLGWGGIGGGIIGAVISIVLVRFFGATGSYILLTAGLIISFICLTKASLDKGVGFFLGLARANLVRLKAKLSNFLFTVEGDEPLPVSSRSVPEGEPAGLAGGDSRPQPVIIDHREQISPEPKQVTAGVEPSHSTMTPPVRDQGEPRALGKAASGQLFKLPPLDLLSRSPKPRGTKLTRDINEKVKLLEDTLESFGVKVKVTQVTYGPAVTRFEVQPAPGIKVSRIMALSDDIALSLAAPQVRIEAPIPGKSALGIEIPNRETAVVHFREVLESPEFQSSSSKLTIALGKDIAGGAVVADLGQMPHLLIAGATGSGKSVCLNALICSLLFKATPDELQLLMIDPKMVELTTFNGIPHLLAPVVTDPKRAATALRWMVSEMEKRYELFAGAGVRDITRYNLLKLHEADNGPGCLPYVVVIIDELADLMMVAPADVEDAICRLAQMARAAGIHLVIATQRPSVDVITGVIKANIPSRVSFAVSSQVDSRTILDSAGAEKLLGRGDMLFLPVGAPKPIRVQGAYVSDKEVDDVVSFLQSQGHPKYDQNIFQKKEEQMRQESEEDELLPEAVRILIESGQASISLLQRRLHIGYTRAARLIDQMEAKGIIGGYEGTKPRAILMTWEQYQRSFGGV